MFTWPIGVEPRVKGDREDKCAQAEVPGSSEPSGQSQKSSFRRATGRRIEGEEMQVNVSEDL